VGLTARQLDSVACHDERPAEFSEVEHLVIRYAERLTASATTDDAIDEALRKHLSDRELVELAITVAIANATTRICNALHVEEDPPPAGRS
jgi:alkylhydroperoxidase family enzyme